MNAEATMMPMTVRQVAEAVQGRLIVPQTGDGVEDGADALATSRSAIRARSVKAPCSWRSRRACGRS